MLIEFRVKNFRSIRDEQVFSMLPTSNKEFVETNTVETICPFIPRVLKSAAIYGPNAGGKSNLLLAIKCMQEIVLLSPKRTPEEQIPVEPFLLNSVSPECPTEFEISFLVGAVRYQYGFSATTNRIIEEYLLVYENPRPQTWFTRTFNAEKERYEYTFSNSFKGRKEVVKASTRPNALFLAIAVQLNNEQLRAIWDCFAQKLIVLTNSERLFFPFANLETIKENPKRHKAICSFLKAADISINSIEFEEVTLPKEAVELMSKLGMPQDKENFLKPLFKHVVEGVSALFEYEQESQGTRTLFNLLAPLLIVIEDKTTLLIDELDASLHPCIVKKVVSLFNIHEDSDKAAQLIFTTHDTTLLQDNSLLRRDQVWFVEKNNEQASSFYSLAAFRPRKGEAFAKGYLQGRYGAIPILDDWRLGYSHEE